MSKLQCELCGGKLIGKAGGIFVCDSCGMEYDTSWAKEQIQKIQGTVQVEGTVAVQGTVSVDASNTVKSLIKRGYLALEDGKWQEAKKHFDQALNNDPECSDAYLGICMANLNFHSIDEMIHFEYYIFSERFKKFYENEYYTKAIRFADETREQELIDYINFNKEYNREKKEKQVSERKQRDAYLEQQKGYLKPIREKYEVFTKRIAAGINITVAVDNNGRILNTKIINTETRFYHGEDVFSNRLWRNLLAVSCGGFHTVGLKADGTVVSTKYVGDVRYYGQCDVSEWRGIIDIATGSRFTVGIKTDGHAVVVGDGYFSDLLSCSQLCHVFAKGELVVALKADGTVLADGKLSDSHMGPGTGKMFYSWNDIVSIAIGRHHLVGLKNDGTVVTYRDTNFYKEKLDVCCDLRDWDSIIAVGADEFCTIGLKSDGTVVAKGEGDFAFLKDWKDIISIAVGAYHIVGMHKDGSIVTHFYRNANDANWGQCNTLGWNIAEKNVVVTTDKMINYQRDGLCRYCGGKIIGLFSKRCSVCGKPKDY